MSQKFSIDEDKISTDFPLLQYSGNDIIFVADGNNSRKNPIKRVPYKSPIEIEYTSREYCSSWKNIQPYTWNTNLSSTIRSLFWYLIVYFTLIFFAFVFLAFMDKTYFLLTVVGPIGLILIIPFGIYVIIRKQKTDNCRNDVETQLIKYRNKIIPDYNKIINNGDKK